MMINLTHGGDTRTVTFNTALRLIPASTEVEPILARLGDGEATSVELNDGTIAEFQWADSPLLARRLVHEPEWPMLALAGGQRPFHAHCKLLLELDVAVLCTGADESEAEHIITEVLEGHRPPPEGFHVVFDHSDVTAFRRQIEVALDSGDLGRLHPTDVIVSGFAEPEAQSPPEYRP